MATTGVRQFRRKMSIDYRIPPKLLAWAEEVGLGNLPVPLLLPEKKVLAAFDMCDAAGKSLPVLSKEQNGLLSRYALEWAASSVINAGQQEKQEISKLAKKVVMGKGRHSEEFIDYLRQKTNNAPAGNEDIYDNLRWAVRALDTQYMLIVDMPLTSLYGRNIAKCSYELPNVHPVSRSPYAAPVRALRRAAAWFGILDVTLAADVPELTNCASFHFEVCPPDGLDLVWIGLEEEGSASRSKVADYTPSPNSGSIGHLVANMKPTPEGGDKELLLFRVKYTLSPSISGLVSASALTSLLATLTLLGAVLIAGRLSSVPEDPAIALLLVVPGALSAYLVRQGEHTLASRLLRGVRLLTLLPSLLLFIAAALLVAHLDTTHLRNAWVVLMCVSAAVTVGISVVALRVRFRSTVDRILKIIWSRSETMEQSLGEEDTQP
jgi:hypothetical protein